MSRTRKSTTRRTHRSMALVGLVAAQAVAGVRRCVACQSERDESIASSTYNRRGSKDSQLR